MKMVLSVSDCEKNVIRQWIKDAKEGIAAVGGDGEGNLYVANNENHQIQKSERDFH